MNTHSLGHSPKIAFKKQGNQALVSPFFAAKKHEAATPLKPSEPLREDTALHNASANALKNQWEAKKQTAAKNKIKTSPIYETIALLGAMGILPGVAMVAGINSNYENAERNYQSAKSHLAISTNKISEKDMLFLNQRVDSLKRETDNARAVMFFTNTAFSLGILTTLTGAGGWLSRAYGKRGKLYLQDTALSTAEVQKNLQLQLNDKALKRLEYLEKYPDLKDFLSTLYGQPVEPSQSVHASQLKDMFEALMYFKLVPGEENYTYNPSLSYYEEIYKRVLNTNQIQDYFPELELMEKVVIPEMKLDTEPIHQAFQPFSFRPLLNSISKADMAVEEKIPQVKQAMSQVESPLLLLKTKLVKEILESIPLEEALKKALTAQKAHEHHLNTQEVVFQELEKSFQGLDSKIEEKQFQLRLAMAATDDTRFEVHTLESQLNALLSEKIRWNQSQMDLVKLKMEKISLNQKSQSALNAVNAAKDRIQKLREPLETLLAEKKELLEAYQHLMSVVDLKQKMGWENHPSVDTTLLQQLLDKEQQNPVLESMVKKFEGQTVLKESALNASIEKVDPS
ncbi:MAG: hypothetical protein K2X66_10310 [Cyanobacteria bacterium]|nr:hypothetical protein [Cyanobacteriota bacterium]